MTGFLYVQSKIEVPLDRHAAFRAAAALDAPKIILPHGPIPGVKSIDGHTAPWSEIGQERTVTLTNGDTVLEKLDVFLPGVSLAYDVRDFTGFFGMLVHEAFGEWEFQDIAPGRSRILWRYTFAATEPFFRPVLWAILNGFYKGFMKAALARFQASIESAPANAPANATA
jgi:hypothetical protein